MSEKKSTAIYRMTYPDGTFVTGTARMLSHASVYSANYIRMLARTGALTADGCTVERVASMTDGGIKRESVAIYIATNPHEDPIIGPAEEIAALTGYTHRYILNLASCGSKTKDGWRIRRATPEEAKEVQG